MNMGRQETRHDMTDLVPGLVHYLAGQEFYGEVVLKWEHGKVVTIKNEQSLKREALVKLLG